MVSGLLAVTIYSATNIGYDNIWQKAKDTGRVSFFESSWDPTVRNSLQAYLIGKVFGLDGQGFQTFYLIIYHVVYILKKYYNIIFYELP